jgi:hypothetical protein
MVDPLQADEVGAAIMSRSTDPLRRHVTANDRVKGRAIIGSKDRHTDDSRAIDADCMQENQVLI